MNVSCVVTRTSGTNHATGSPNGRTSSRCRNMRRRPHRLLTNSVPVAAVVVCLSILAVACSSDTSSTGAASSPTGTTKPIDYNGIGLWNDGPCDPTKPPLTIGLMTVFESPVISLKDQVTALEASGDRVQLERRRQRLLHQGRHVRRRREPDQSLGCVRTIDTGRRRGDGERPGHWPARPRCPRPWPRPRSLASRRTCQQRRLGGPERLPDRRVRHRRRVLAATGPHRCERQGHRHRPGRLCWRAPR